MGDADAFEAITAVNDGPMPREALPTDAIEPLILIEPVGIMKPVPITTTIVEGAATTPTQHETATTEMPALSVEALLVAATRAATDPAASAAAAEASADRSSPGRAGSRAHAVDPTSTDALADDALAITVAAAEESVDVEPRADLEPGADLEPVEPRADLEPVEPRAELELRAAPELRADLDDRAGCESASLRRAADSDRIARQRGLTPIMEPYVRDSSPPSRIWSRVSIATSIVCLAIAVGAVLWARAEVLHARAEARPARSMPASQPMPALQPMQAAAEPPTSASQPVAAEPPAPQAADEEPTQQVAGDQAPPVATEPAQPQPAVAEPAPIEHDMTELTVRTRPAGATVTYNGEVLGTTPLVVKVHRNERGTLRLRAPGMQSEARRILPKHATKTIRVTLKPRR